ncbi:SRPBCC family protein [Streptacidiphilus sp. EB129]|jgi:hypothetical protein|uniref:SRPBCC family protein n=1 Tax=Streptacidiphilus sp. EB129 TaxID=3156262 RepID=UPI0035156A0D
MTSAALHHYTFTSVWELPAPPRQVFAELADPRRYPLWWPEVREVRQLDEHSGTMRIRSLLPFELAVLAREARQDPAAGVLEATLSGDLCGLTRWTVTGRGDGAAVAVFHEDVEAHKPLLRRLAVPGRPVFRANHALMMRSGRLGLIRHLALRDGTATAPGIGLDQ